MKDIWKMYLAYVTLFALIFSIGILVDDAIVVVENIKRHIERGLTPLQAARQGATEVGFTLLAMNLALVVISITTGGSVLAQRSC